MHDELPLPSSFITRYFPRREPDDLASTENVMNSCGCGGAEPSVPVTSTDLIFLPTTSRPRSRS
jgi:hypothetical protein